MTRAAPKSCSRTSHFQLLIPIHKTSASSGSMKRNLLHSKNRSGLSNNHRRTPSRRHKPVARRPADTPINTRAHQTSRRSTRGRCFTVPSTRGHALPPPPPRVHWPPHVTCWEASRSTGTVVAIRHQAPAQAPGARARTYGPRATRTHAPARTSCCQADPRAPPRQVHPARRRPSTDHRSPREINTCQFAMFQPVRAAPQICERNQPTCFRIV